MTGSRFPFVNLPFVEPKTLNENAQNWRYLNHLNFQAAAGTRWRTVVIAAANSTVNSKLTADYVCGGANDEVTINAAILALENGVAATASPGRIVLLEGTFEINGPININALTRRTLSIEGMGSGVGQAITAGGTISGTVIHYNGSADHAINVGGNGAGAGSSVILENFAVIGASTVALVLSADMSTVVRFCNIIQGGTGGGFQQTHTTGSEANSRVESCNVFCTANGGAHGSGIEVSVGPSSGQTTSYIKGNYVSMVDTAALGIALGNDASALPSYIVVGNTCVGPGTSSTSAGIASLGTSVQDCVIESNRVTAFANGIWMSGYHNVIVGNTINGCSIGVLDRGFQFDYSLIASNVIAGCGTGVSIGASTSTTGCSIIGNRISQGTGTNAIVVGSHSTGAGVFINDTDGGGVALADTGVGTRTGIPGGITVGMLPVHHTTHETGGSDAITGNVDSNARVGVRRNSTGSTSKRRRVNLIEGTNISIAVADDAVDEEVDVTISASSGAGTATYKVNSVTVGVEAILNLIAGTGVTLAAVDTGTEVDVTITVAGAAAQAGNETNYFMHG